MATSVTVRNLPDRVIRKIRARAKENGRSMETELRELIKFHYTAQERAQAVLKKARALAEKRGIKLSPPDVLKARMNEGR